MSEEVFYRIALAGVFVAAAATALALVFVTAPYGRHARSGWGPGIPSALGWLIMESPAALVVAVLFVAAERPAGAPAVAFLAMWEAHYAYRAFAYPFLRRGGRRSMPLSVVVMAIAFNAWNGYLNGRCLFSLCPARDASWLADPRFVVGAALFVAGMWINRRSDATLRSLRAPGETGYRIPRGGLFEYVSSPNYLGELVEWVGWAIATWSLAGLAFAVFTAANLLPRAVSHHRWYRGRFPEYPEDRRAVIPFLL